MIKTVFSTFSLITVSCELGSWFRHTVVTSCERTVCGYKNGRKNRQILQKNGSSKILVSKIVDFVIAIMG